MDLQVLLNPSVALAAFWSWHRVCARSHHTNYMTLHSFLPTAAQFLALVSRLWLWFTLPYQLLRTLLPSTPRVFHLPSLQPNGLYANLPARS